MAAWTQQLGGGAPTAGRGLHLSALGPWARFDKTTVLTPSLIKTVEIMFFSYLARIIAALSLLIGVSQLLLGISIGEGLFLPYEQALARYAPGSKSAGAVIDRGVYAIVVATILGAVAEVSFRLRQMQRDR